MFTGLVEEVGTVESFERLPAGARLRVRCRTVLEDLREGSSIAVNGVCLTARELRRESFAADLAPETLARSNLGDVRPGSLVNLERPLSASGRLGGHIVQGHVDGTGEFLSLEPLGSDNWWLRIRVPPELDRYLVYKGSVAIDGISLTVASIEASVLSVTIVPHTYENTNLRTRRLGDRVNLECDILAKYLDKLLVTREALPEARRLTLEKLREMGY
ncbi:MAG: riboflavin synthase [Bryobacterales bacterium]|nr:riboflavin synthase [Bryobacteraceae bacterium]MDW8354664.1 riboflavin synthase [Bryobacterales bacterium]